MADKERREMTNLIEFWPSSGYKLYK